MDREEVANPYVKMYLRPPIDQKLRQTSVQHQTINPVWDEYFKFGVTNEIIMKSAKTLHFYIYNYAHSSRPECIGEAQIRLTPQTMRGCDLWCTINKQRAVIILALCPFHALLAFHRPQWKKSNQRERHPASFLSLERISCTFHHSRLHSSMLSRKMNISVNYLSP